MSKDANAGRDVAACPYAGPVPITEEGKLFGRQREVANVRDLLISERIVLLYSPSGAGKSSLVQAGVAPVMARRGFTVRRVMRVHAEPPPHLECNRYVLSALVTLEEAEGKTPDVARLARMTLSDYFGSEVNGELLLFDQFEEVLTIDPMNRPAKQAFFEQLGQLLSCNGRWALFAMREDYLAGLDSYQRYVPTRMASTYRLDLPKTEQAIQGIQGPVNTLAVTPKLEFTTEAARALAENLSTMTVQNEVGEPVKQVGEYVEPVQLQVVCLRLWNQYLAWVSDPSKPVGVTCILPDHVRGDEGIDAALQAYYQDIVTRVSAARGTPERILRDWFDRNLITDLATRGQVRQRGDERTVQVNAALPDLVNSYLVRSDRRLGSIWYELAHDRLIGPVRANNKTWREENLSDLERACELWLPAKDSDRLLRGNALEAARTWALSHQLQPDEAEFLEASEEAEAARLRELEAARQIAEANRKLQHRNRYLLAGMLVVVGVALFAWFAREQAIRAEGVAVEAKSKADTEARKAECARVLAEVEADEAAQSELEADKQRGLAMNSAEVAERNARAANIGRIVSQSLAEQSDHIDRKILLAMEAWRREPSHPTFTALYEAFDLSRRLRGLLHHDTAVVAAAFHDKLGLLVSASSQNGTIRLWNRNLLPVGEPVKPLAGEVVNLAMGVNGLLAAAHSNGIISLYRILDQAPWIELTHASAAASNRSGRMPLAFSPSGAHLVAGTKDGSVELFRIEDNRRLRQVGPFFFVKDKMPQSQPDEVVRISFRPDGKEMLSLSLVTGAYLWDTSDLAKPAGMSGRRIETSWEFFGPPQGPWQRIGLGFDSLSLVRPENEGKVQSISLKFTGHPPTELVTQYSRRRVAIGAKDGAVRLVRIPSGEELETLRGHSNEVRSMALGFEQQVLATVATNDPRVWVWNLSRSVSNFSITALSAELDQRRYIAQEGVKSVAIAPDGKWFASISALDPRLTLTRLGLPQGAPDASRQSPVATPILSPEVRFANLRFGGWRPTLAISPNGKLLLVGDGAAKVTFWDYAALTSTAPDWNRARLGEFSPSRTTLSDGRHPVPRHVSCMAVSHDSRLLGIGLYDPNSYDYNRFVVVVYDISDWKTPRFLMELPAGGNTGNLYSDVAFSPKEHILAAGNEQEVRIWDLASRGGSAQLLPGSARRVVFSPDGRTLATASRERIRLLDIDVFKSTGELRYATALQSPQQCDTSLVFSPNGKILANTCNSQEKPQLLMWDVENGQQLGEPIVTDQPYTVGGFTPDGKQLILSSWVSSLATMDFDPARWLPALCARASRNLTLAEWRRYVSPTEPYRKTCPDLPAGDLTEHGKSR
ncbi:MAG: hypothetical protein HY820_33615 [Acidobacteria bacterium]|nr:hypothetical protein [Acidobacteriota bacterium]